MTQETVNNDATETEAPVTHVAPGPHLGGGCLTARWMMLDVLIGLLPVLLVSLWVFGWYAARVLAICVGSCVVAEGIFTAMRRRQCRLGDFSAVVTGVILAFSLPGTAPWYVAVIGSFAAIGIGKLAFGGLGQNIFNPAMVGRAFVMIAFTSAMAAGGYVASEKAGVPDALTQATPMTALQQEGKVASLGDLFWGDTNGSLGETSAFACLLGGLYLLIRRTAAWQIPLGVLLAVGIIAGGQNLMDLQAKWTVGHHLMGGALLFGALFIATDPVTSPLTGRGRWIFGLGIGAIVMLLRSLSAYPEGVMFAVLLMNAVVPLINRWTVPRPVGGPVPSKA